MFAINSTYAGNLSDGIEIEVDGITFQWALTNTTTCAFSMLRENADGHIHVSHIETKKSAVNDYSLSEASLKSGAQVSTFTISTMTTNQFVIFTNTHSYNIDFCTYDGYPKCRIKISKFPFCNK